MAEVPTVADLLAEYRATLLKMHEERGLAKGARRWNRLVNQMQSVHLQLRVTSAGRAGISTLIDDECITVRQWSATNALAWDTKRSGRSETFGRGQGQPRFL